MTNKERYKEWTEQLEYIPVFMTPWWLDAVCAGKEWDVLLAEDENGQIVGAMPYLLRKFAWFRYITMPPMTHIGGMWVTPEVTADKWKTAEVCRQLKEQLDALGIVYYRQQYLPGSLCVDAMRGLGCKTKEMVTYRVDDLSSLDAVIEAFSKNKKRRLQKALSLHAERKMEVEDFYRFHTSCMAARKRKMQYTREFLLVIERKARRLGQCEILSVCNADGKPYAAAFLLIDKNYMRFLIPAFDPAYRESGASALLVLEAMKMAREKHVRFEFGVPTEKGDEKAFKQFGPMPVSFFTVEKSYRWWSFLVKWFGE